jgi:hypothetical protein
MLLDGCVRQLQMGKIYNMPWLQMASINSTTPYLQLQVVSLSWDLQNVVYELDIMFYES